jgi:hypothetical protein
MRRPLRIGHGHVGVGCPRQVLSKRLPRRLRSHRRPNPSTRPCPGAFAFASASTPMSSSAPASTSRSTATATVSPSPAFAAVRRRRGKQNASTSTSNHSTHLFGRIETPLLGPLPSLETGDTDTRPVFARHVEDAEDVCGGTTTSAWLETSRHVSALAAHPDYDPRRPGQARHSHRAWV